MKGEGRGAEAISEETRAENFQDEIHPPTESRNPQDPKQDVCIHHSEIPEHRRKEYLKAGREKRKIIFKGVTDNSRLIAAVEIK